jgi:hypothetical protein
LLISTLTPKLLADFDLRMPRTMPTFREDPATYMRDYRARKRELAATCDKAASIKGVVTTVNGRLDAMTKEAFEARRRASPAAQHSPPAAMRPATSTPPSAARPRPTAAGPSPAATTPGPLAIYRPPLAGEVMPPPRSMQACGGTPPSRYPVHETIAALQVHAAAQERANAAMSQRLAALESAKAETDRRLAAIEQRGDGFVAVLKGLTLLFS